MLDDPEYRQRWEEKRPWYDRYYPGSLITTEDSPTLSRTVEDLIHTYFAKDRGKGAANQAAGSLANTPDVAQGPQSFSPTNMYYVRVLTEGPTDWKHLKAALRRLKQRGLFHDLEIEFQEDELDTGESELLRICRQYARQEQPHPVVCLFDRDVPATLRDVVTDGKNYKHWGKRVYSAALPIPDHRQSTPNICIEFYYPDGDIQRKDAKGRRLFIGTEFSSRTSRHLSEPLLCADRNKTGKFTIIDSQVYSSNSSSEENVALSKNAFAQYVLSEESNFHNLDISAFVGLFTLIEEIGKTQVQSVASQQQSSL